MPTSVQRYSHAELLKDVRLDIDESIPSIAIVGFGKMGLLHSIILNLLKPNSIKYIVDKSTIVRLSGKLLLKGVKFLPSVEKLLEEDFDAVFVTTPTSTHYPVVKRLLEAGIRKIFVEKPPTRNSRELENLLDLSKGLTIMVGFQKRYSFPFRHAKILLDSRLIGEIEKVNCSIKSGDITEPTSRYDRVGRGVLLDLGVHVVDILCWFFKDIKVVDAKSRTLYTHVDDFFEATLRVDESIVSLETTWSDPSYRLPETTLEIQGSEGMLKVSDDYLKLRLNEVDSRLGVSELTLYKPHYYADFPPVLVGEPEYSIEDIHFLSCLKSEVEPLTNLRTSLSTMQLIDELYRVCGYG